MLARKEFCSDQYELPWPRPPGLDNDRFGLRFTCLFDRKAAPDPSRKEAVDKVKKASGLRGSRT